VGTGFPKENATNQKSRALSDLLEAESARAVRLVEGRAIGGQAEPTIG
jgi:hypothetical protein